MQFHVQRGHCPMAVVPRRGLVRTLCLQAVSWQPREGGEILQMALLLAGHNSSWVCFLPRPDPNEVFPDCGIGTWQPPFQKNTPNWRMFRHKIAETMQQRGRWNNYNRRKDSHMGPCQVKWNRIIPCKAPQAVEPHKAGEVLGWHKRV